jgi:peptidyl-prolyl cis-trans isomerase A (cyclophilin A)
MKTLLACLASAAVACTTARAEEQTEPAAETPAPEPVAEEAKPAEPAPPVIVVIETSMGTITAELDADKAPITVANFIAYMDAGHYSATIFHRVIKGFMIQGGGFDADMRQKNTRAPIKLESDNGLKNERGTLAMARTGIPDSATSQFFINHADNASLNHARGNDGYAVFGKVTDGMDVVDAIANVLTGNSGMHQNVPKEPVFIKKISRKPEDE